MKTLVICEKNIAARRIAQILSGGKAKRVNINGIPCYCFDDKIFIGLKGHIMYLDFPEEYENWQNIPPEKLIDVTPVKKISERKIADAIRKLAKDVSRVIIATDYDREGELIGTEVLSLIPKDVEIKRAKFSSITPYEIKKSFENLGSIDYNLSKSAEARQHIDLIWGASLTRFISISSEQLGKDFLSVGRVQSPTLALIVERENEIRNFIPKPFWRIEVIFEKNGEKFKAEYPKIINDEKFADEILSKLKEIGKGIVKSFSKKEVENMPPPPFDTTSFLSEASKIGFSAMEAMKIAEELYMNGLISYPRTDNTVYPPLPFKSILEKLKEVFPDEIKKLEGMMRSKPVSGKKESKDHPPIHPVDCKRLQGKQAKIYELIARRFMATLAKNALIEVKNAEVVVGEVNLKASGLKIKEKNWMEIYKTTLKEEALPDLFEGEEVKILDIKKIKGETKPPARYTQGSLILEMERRGLGTKSTRHEIISKLYERNYIRGKYISPTPSAFAVIDALRSGADIITKPDMTAHIEKEMDGIAEGKKSFSEVVEESKELLRKAFEILNENKKEIGEKIKIAMEKQNYFGDCPKCGGKLVLRKSKHGRFIGCSNYPRCSNIYSIPKTGSVFFEGEYCNKCKSPMITIISKGKKWKRCLKRDCK
ncbi:MAG: DNA topoisomerase I [Thermoplasmatales archaeon]|nr:DNA topoisomerase I [Thermoplasmatales archaeon]